MRADDRRITILLIAIFILVGLCRVAYPATGDVLFSCDFDNTGTTAADKWDNAGGDASTIFSNNSQLITGVSGNAARLNVPGGYDFFAPLEAPISPHQRELTIVYYERYDTWPITGANIKSIRPFFGVGEYSGALVTAHTTTKFYEYHGVSATWTPNMTYLTWMQLGGSYPTSNGDGTYTTVGRVRFQWSMDGGVTDGMGTSWHKIRLYVLLPSASGVADGAEKVWIDENLVYELDNVKITTSNELKFYDLRFYPSDESDESYHHDLDEVVVYEGYVGPTGSGAITTTITGGGGDGRWRVADQTPEDSWHISGYTKTGLLPAVYTVEYQDVFGWDTPADDSVTVTNGATSTPSGTYTGQTASILVNIASENPTGAAWSIDGGEAWNDGGDTVSSLNVYDSPFTITFQSVTGYTKPSDITDVYLSDGVTATYNVSYTSPVGSLTVNIDPAGAVSGGAMWRRTGETTWRLSGVTETGVTAGSVDIEFLDITGWDTPSNVTGVTITAGQETIVDSSTTYTRQTGSLQVTISPAGAVTAGAQWRRVGEETWQDSGDTEADIPTDTYVVEFKTTTGYVTPANIADVTITDGGTTTLDSTDGALYTQAYGSLSITFSPNNPTGAQWKVDSGDWKTSGQTVSDIDVSANPHTVTYDSVSDYSAPSGENFNAVADTTSYLTRSYTPTSPTKSVGCVFNASFGK